MLWEYPLSEIFLMGFFLVAVSFIFAWVFDSILDSAGYGIFGNAFFIYIGVVVGAICLNTYGYELSRFPLVSFITISCICFSLFLTTLILKKAIN